jgi:3-demethoxyubiquinol 3-hydroxylase
VLGRGPHAAQLEHMQAQEQLHLDVFSEIIAKRRVRPTALLPIWHIAGFVLGAVTAAMGPEAAMACTVAVEETIDAHYSAQREALGTDESELRETVEKFRLEELAHRDIALANGAERTPGYKLLSGLIRAGCAAAIRISEKI